jgi:hypothetical protein
MTTSRRVRLLVPIGAILAVAAVFLTHGEHRPDYSKASRRLHSDLEARLKEIAAAYDSGNRVAHLKATSDALRLTNRASIRALLPEVDQLINAISKGGLAPYASLAIDLGYRLGRVQRPETQAKLTELAKVVLAHAEPTSKGGKQSEIASLVRRKGTTRYRLYDADLVRAMARLEFSDYGRRQLERGQEPADLVRTLAMVWSCRKEGDDARTAKGIKDCRKFVDIIASALSQSGPGGPALDTTLADVKSGIKMGAFDCLEAERGDETMVAALESYTACMASQTRNPTQWFIDGSAVASNWTGAAPQVSGYEHVKSTETVRYGPNGNTGTQVTHEYTNNSGGTMSITNYSTIVDGQEESGTFVSTDDGNGNSHEELRNSKGEVVRSFSQHNDGSTETFERQKDGSSTTVKTDSQGVSTIEHTDKEGNVSTATVDENGKCKGAACSASTPVDDSGAAPACSLNPGNPLKTEEGLNSDPLGPYVYPQPESAGSNPLLSCLIGSLGSMSKTKCPPSVAMCLEEPPDGTCGCGKPRQGAPERTFEARCAQMMCADGSSCDPQTGTCRSSSSGDPLAGLSPSVQPFAPPTPGPGPGHGTSPGGGAGPTER